ncbi:hypothetical protein PC118_g6358 [Phytophthora cactorum]|uniref:Retroviral polymerase SH3-like domain-containing protein n=1 Tax=Phytophthora cactorum TaxID=29920 RepID=A0A8T1CI85_9STRA|nr:hypothetical protein PC115_g9452 [Phytophthora cactorum]KAG2989088.1 hypothetical protein PC118_g6358 [Phytophthora cactorum]KAG3088459.1 hypothetical protein PC122_g8337 [Phytophthora cactorum]
MKLENKRFRCMFLEYVENVKGYRVFDLERSKLPEQGTVIHVTKDSDEAVVPHPVERQPVMDELMEAVQKPVADVKMDVVERFPSAVAPTGTPCSDRTETGRVPLTAPSFPGRPFGV